ncbi:MAG: adenosylcobinamide-GDP ribazoletransferase [Methylococcales bacterium]|nr:adenosylcobinamide-GDP ribazoletransferase [Methylococcales bacterium]
MNSFLLALQFLTIIPVTRSFIASDKQLGASAVFYPIVGLLIGALLVLLAYFIGNMPLPIQAALILTLWVLLTGGLHLDGLADCADAWVGGLGSQQRSLEIMKDPAAGPIAVVILVLVLLLKWTMISYVLEKQAFEVLLITPMLGRLALLIMMLFTTYVRVDGLGAKIVANLPNDSAKAVSLLSLLISAYYLGVLAIAFMLIMLFIIKYHAKKRLGGVTGDVYGAAVELVEVSILLGVLI